MAVIIDGKKIYIDKDGFISEDDIKNSYFCFMHTELLKYIKQLNAYIYELYDRLSELINIDDEASLLILSLLIEMHKDYQSMVIIASRGLKAQGAVFARTILEKLFILKAVCNDNVLVEDWEKTQNYKTNGLIIAINKKKKGLEEIYKNRGEIKQLENAKERKIEWWASKAGMKEEYNREYQYFTNYVHFSHIELKDILCVDENGSPYLDIAPSTDYDIPFLLTACSYVLRGVVEVMKYYEIELDDRLKAFKEIEKREWKKCAEVYAL